MIKVQFKLKEPKSDNETSVRLMCYINGDRLVFGTDKSINPKLWDIENQRPISQNRQKADYKSLISKFKKEQPQIEATLSNLNNRLSRMEASLAAFITQLDAQNIKATKTLCYDHLNSIYNEKETPLAAKAITLKEYIKIYYEEIESGKRLYNNKRYQPGTLKNYRGFIAQFDEYQKISKKVLDLIQKAIALTR
jgi:DNA-directed RNA polymerase